MADDLDSWRDAPPPVQLMPFLRLSTIFCNVLHLIEGPNPFVEAAAALDLQAQRHEEQLHLMRWLFAEQLTAMQNAVCNKVRAFLAEAGLGLEAQDAAVEEEEDEEDELPRAFVEDAN